MSQVSEAEVYGGLERIDDARYYRIPLELIEPNPYQPRQFFDRQALLALGESIKKIGQLEDILVRPHEGKFQIVLGERRWRACTLVGLPTINAKIRTLTDEETYVISLAENVQREELTGVEEAFAFKRFLDQGMTQAEVGETLGKLDDRVGAKLKLLSSSYYVRYLEAKLEEAQADLRRTQRENDLLRGVRTERRDVRITDEEGMARLLGEDWELVTTLPDGRFVLRSPAAASASAG